MTKVSLLRGVVPLACALGMVWACSSGGDKKKVPLPFDGDAGSAGASGDSNASAGSGNSAGKGTGATGGTGGDQGEAGFNESGAPATGGTAGSGGTSGTAASGGTSGTAGSGGTSGSAGSGGASGSGGTTSAPPIVHGLYLSPTGLDTNGGSHDAPYLTLAKAVAGAQSGDTLVLLDGTYAPQTFVNIPDGVNVVADHSGAAILGCSFGKMFTLLGSSYIGGVTFNNCSQPVVATTAGKLDMVDLLVINGSDSSGAGSIHIGGTVVATFSASTPEHVYTMGGTNTLGVSDSASLTVTSGIFKNLNNGSFSGNATLRASATSKLLVKDTVFVDVSQPGVSGGDSADITLDHVTMDVLGNNAVLLRDNATFTSKNQTHLALTALAPSRAQCVATANGAISITDTDITGCSSGVVGVLPTNLTITGSHIHDNDGLGIDVNTNGTGTLTVTNTELNNNGTLSSQIPGAVRVTGSILNVKFRGVNVHNNGGTNPNYYGIAMQGTSGSSYDFGTFASPGGNTFLGGTGGAALTIQSPAGLTVPAVGNTWVPSLQGADASGKYAVTSGTKLEIIGPVTNPPTANYHLATTIALDLAATQ